MTEKDGQLGGNGKAAEHRGGPDAGAQQPSTAKPLLWLPVPLVLGATIAWIVVRALGLPLGDHTTAVMGGLAILGAAFMLTWAAEVAQLDISQGLALAAVALIAVLPEYAVGMYFAWTAGRDPAYCHYALANMTGANRLLIGFGWPLMVLLWWLRTRRRAIEIHEERHTELGFMAIATVYAFIIPLKRTLGPIDAAVLLTVFGLYLYRTSFGRHVEPELVGPSELIASAGPLWRRVITAGMFAYAAGVIMLATKPFAEALLAIGRGIGVDEFILVQWLAPLASEAPEITVAALFALRRQADMALGTLLSSKVNQWTLLVGTLPTVYCLSGMQLHSLPLDNRQVEEVLLTAAQSIFGFVVLTELRLSVGEAMLLFGLFAGQLLSPGLTTRLWFSGAYIVLAVLWFAASRHHRVGVADTLRHVFVRPSGEPSSE